MCDSGDCGDNGDRDDLFGLPLILLLLLLLLFLVIVPLPSFDLTPGQSSLAVEGEAAIFEFTLGVDVDVELECFGRTSLHTSQYFRRYELMSVHSGHCHFLAFDVEFDVVIFEFSCRRRNLDERICIVSIS